MQIGGVFILEVKINREIRNYTESMFFGLSMRQFICSVLGCGAAVAAYFLLKSHIGLELTTWACVIVVIPFAALGFLRYNGMPAERLLMAYVKYRWLVPRKLTCKPVSLYYEMMKPSIEEKRKEMMKR